MQRRIRVRGKYCGATQEGLLSVMHKELLQIDKKKTNHSKVNWTKDMKICRRENLTGQQTEKDPLLQK